MMCKKINFLLLLLLIGNFTFPKILFASDSFDAATGVLHMPIVSVGTETYDVFMQHQGDLVFVVTSATPTQETSSTPDTFDFGTGVLHMPSVVVGTETYVVDMLHQGDLVFNVTSASLTSGGSSTEVSGTAFNEAYFGSAEGVWRIESTVNSTLTTPLEFGSVSLDTTVSSDIEYAMVISNAAASSGQIVTEGCNGLGPQSVDANDTEDLIPSDSEGSDINEGICDGDVTPTTSYSQTGSTTFTISNFCGADLAASITLTKISDSAGFDLGSLSFSSDQFSDLNTSDGVCGSVISSNSTTSYPQPNSFGLEDMTTTSSIVTVAAPYGDEHAMITFIFGQSTLSSGTFTVNDGVTATISSANFGGSSTLASTMIATSGTVTISSATSLAVSGSFNIVTTTGDNIQGSFSFNLE